MSSTETVLIAASGCGTLYSLWTAFLLHRRQAGRHSVANGEKPPPPVSFFRPIKRGVPRLREFVEMLIQTALPGDQVILGVDSDEDYETCTVLRTEYPDREVVVCRCPPGEALNPKINKLIQMSREAAHDHWLLSDSEVWMTPDFVERFRAQWHESGADVLTAGYRFVNARTFTQTLDQAALLLTLWPGLAASEQLGPIRFTLGACTGLHREDLNDAGGWERFANFLAEDNRLGAIMAREGKQVMLSKALVSIETDPLTWRDYFRHQHRVGVTYRVSDPAGYFGMLVTHGLSFASLLVILGFTEPWRWGVLLVVYFSRLAAAKANSRVLAFPVNRFALIVLLAGFAETFFWCASWLPGRVVWGPRSYRVSAGGAIR